MQTNKILAFIISLVFFLGIVYFVIKLSQPENVSYQGLSDNKPVLQNTNTNNEAVVDVNGQTKLVTVANDPAFNPRSFTAGGDSWLLSVTESQPKVFTGKLLANNGVETYDIFLQEADNFYTGDATSKKDNSKAEFSLQKQNGTCKDKEGSSFEYSVVAIFKSQTLNGCGGNVVSNATNI